MPKLTIPKGLTAARALRAIRALRSFTAPGAPPGDSQQPGRASNLADFERLWWHDVVLGYGLGEEWTDCRPTGRLALRVYVNRKLPRARLKKRFRIPGALCIHVAKGAPVDLPTDVVVLRRIPAAQRTVSAGESMGHFVGTRGTFGLAVAATDGKRYALTCAHVVAPAFLDPQDDPVESPADTDGEAGPNVMGTVSTWTQLDSAVLNTADAALVKPATGITLSNGSLGLAHPPRFSPLTSAQIAAMAPQPIVVHTRRGAIGGTIDAVGNDLPFDFDGRFFRFTDIVSYVAPVEPGDSGSAVVHRASRDVLGLHFAGSEADGLGYGIPATTIIRAFPGLGLTVA